MKRAITLILCLSLALCACSAEQFLEPGTFYYHRADIGYQGSEGVVAPEQRELSGISGDLDAIVDLYCAGPQDPALETPLPSDTALLSSSLHDDVLTLRFNAALAQLTGAELTIAAGCLAKTFLPLSGAKALILTADGALLGGDTALTVTLEDLSLRDDSLDLLHAEFPVYYASMDRRHLIRETVTIRHATAEELTMQLLEQLLTPPAGTTLRSALPTGTRFLSVSVANGLCTVDVSREFESRRFYAMSAQCLSLLSVVNTLTALEEIDRVEFTVEGDLLIRYGSLSITAPLVRDERCVGLVRTGLGEIEGILYLVHGNRGQLVAIPAKLRPSPSTTLPELVLQQLLQDPGTNGIRSCIPAGTRLLSASVEGGICTVDLSAEYLDQPDLLPWSGRVIAATLCELEGINGVRILVNGSVPSGFDAEWFGILSPQDDWFL